MNMLLKKRKIGDAKSGHVTKRSKSDHVGKRNKGGLVKKRSKKDHIAENEGHVGEKNDHVKEEKEVESSEESSDDGPNGLDDINAFDFRRNRVSDFDSESDDEFEKNYNFFANVKITFNKIIEDYGDVIRLKFPDSESDDDYNFPEISLSELLEDMKEKNKETAAESRIQPPKILPRELKRNFIDEEYSSKSKRVKLDILSNAKRKHEYDSKSNCEELIKKIRYDSPQIEELKYNPATYDQSEDIYDDMVKCLDREIAQYESKDSSSEELLKEKMPDVPFRMEKQKNADSVESDMLERLNNDSSSKMKNPATYDQNELYDTLINNSFDKTKETFETVMVNGSHDTLGKGLDREILHYE